MHRYSSNLECHSDSDGCDNWVTIFNLKSCGKIDNCVTTLYLKGLVKSFGEIDSWVTTFNLKSSGEIEADANGDCLAGSFEKQLNKTCLHFPTKYRISLNRNKIA